MNNQQPQLFDLGPPPIPADITISRHRGSPESIAANPSQEAKRASHERILQIVRVQGTSYLHQICRILDKPPNEVSPRLSELKEMGRLEKTGEKIEKCAVLRLKI